MTDVRNEEVRMPESLEFLVRGYSEYAQEVVVDRAIDGIDGLKPSQRRILYTMYAIEKVKDMTKSQTVAGATMKLHPHGDASIYDTMVRMVDASEYMAVPYLNGQGTFGKVYSVDPPAAARYTNVKFAPIASELFNQMNGVNMIPNYDSTYEEPELLPVSYPTVLTTPVSGIAVGIATERPPFNFNEVNDMVIEYIEKGTFSHYLIPDFPTGGYIVKDEKELEKIMNTGNGRITLRGKWFIDGRKIIIEEIPYYTTENAIKKKIEDNIEQGVTNVKITTDRINGLRIEVTCSNRKVVDEVLNEILRVTDLQMTMKANMVVIIDNRPRKVGVKELIQEWIKFREGVLERSLKQDLEYYIRQIARYEVLDDLIKDDAKRNQFTETLSKQGVSEARTLLVDWYPEAEKDVYDWILDMKLRQFTRKGDHSTRLNNLRSTKAQIESDLTNIRGVIVRELKALNNKYKFPRKTVITDDVITFEEVEKVVVKAEPEPTIVQVDGKFVKKLRHTRMTEQLDGIRCMSNDVITFIDTHGRLLRVDLDNLTFVNESDRGIYLPLYIEEEDNFDVVAFDVIADKKVSYLYSDGFASVLDLSEWVDAKRVTRITQNGVSPYAPLIISELDPTHDFYMMQTAKGYFGFVSTEFKHKHRTARTKLVGVQKDDHIVLAVPITYPEILTLVTSPERYLGKLSKIASSDSFNMELYEKIINR